MTQLDAFKVDAFTSTPYEGNGAGVVLEAQALDARQMQAMAREMNLSETAFVLRASRADADLRLRYFTPTVEVPLCGHATVAALHVLDELGRVPREKPLRIETNEGIIHADVRADGRVFLGGEAPRVEPSPVQPDAIARALGVPHASLAQKLPPLLVRGQLIVPVAGLDAMKTMTPDAAAIGDLARLGIDGVVALSLETQTDEAFTHIRYFAPAVGIPEDPVTGVAHLALAAYLLHTGAMHARCVFVGEQGHFCGRPGRVEVECGGTKDAPDVRVDGHAVTVLRGKMNVP